jgi:hypothetical protein
VNKEFVSHHQAKIRPETLTLFVMFMFVDCAASVALRGGQRKEKTTYLPGIFLFLGLALGKNT